MIRAFGFLSLACCAQAAWVQQEPEVTPFNAKHSMWVLEKNAPADHPITLTVALKVEEGARAQLEQVFFAVSDPKHEKYGQHLSVNDITNLFAIPQSRVATVSAYFQGLGATDIKVAPNRDMLTVVMPVASAENALKTKLAFFTHIERSDHRIVRASTTYHLPAEIAEHIDLVGELLQFPRLRLKSLTRLTAGGGSWPNACTGHAGLFQCKGPPMCRGQSEAWCNTQGAKAAGCAWSGGSASRCAGLVTPAVLAQRYKLPGNSSKNAVGNSMAVAEFQGQYYKDTDLATFSSGCYQNVKVDKTIGGDQQTAGIEAELDIEYIKSVAPQVPLTVVYDAKYSLLGWANQINSMADAPLIHSVSYGNDEIQQTSVAYMSTVNTAFLKAGAKGLSILFASGDQGVCGRSGCAGKSGSGLHARFHPDFPAASPYVTAVGGTDFASAAIGDETAWSAGGGGFSDTFAIPDWQKTAVAAYKASPDAALPPQNLWNNTGRGYPDIAALGGQKAPYCIASRGEFEGVAGTSASCPVASGIFALLNGLRLSAGKAPLGFLNPFIYQNPNAFNDVTSGVNGANEKIGFKAIKGWDASTGWGTPDYEAMSKVVMAGIKETNSIVV